MSCDVTEVYQTITQSMPCSNHPGALAFEDQLAPRLAEHLIEVYGGGGQGKVATGRCVSILAVHALNTIEHGRFEGNKSGKESGIFHAISGAGRERQPRFGAAAATTSGAEQNHQAGAFSVACFRNPYHASVSTPPALHPVGGFLTASRKVNRPVTLQKANA